MKIKYKVIADVYVDVPEDVAHEADKMSSLAVYDPYDEYIDPEEVFHDNIHDYAKDLVLCTLATVEDAARKAGVGEEFQIYKPDELNSDFEVIKAD